MLSAVSASSSSALISTSSHSIVIPALRLPRLALSTSNPCLRPRQPISTISTLSSRRPARINTGPLNLPTSLSLSRGVGVRAMATTAATSTLPDSSIPVFQRLEQLRAWRDKAFEEGKSVGFVPTMGALHDGHLELVRRSLQDNDLTIVSIFVNPTQFAPHEDLASYPRTLAHDLAALSSLHVNSGGEKTTSAVFAPSVEVMYPPAPEPSTFYYSPNSHSPPTPNLGSSPTTSPSANQSPPEFVHSHQPSVGTFVEVRGLGSSLEGRSRPHFFRGVATVVTKLFNAVQPTHAYFGQKDIQQALLLRRMVRDLLVRYPTEENVHVVPTTRLIEDSRAEIPEGLALSSRNAYLTRAERAHAPALYRALQKAQQFWDQGRSKVDCIHAAVDVLEMEEIAAAEDNVHLKVDYIEISDPWSFEAVSDVENKFSGEREDRPFVLSGAVWVGGTRLIDNLILGDSKKILY